ncbi:peptidylprolyl isomerase [Sphingomonas sp. ID1715]|uniref:peptidylprolyl isomerase n=1 Tax=Sphingomonas sp. ID1715 TaxID=1656898 RepID=UPI0014882851|nr:peptidylprolyl isomerase [Sphingomonas sp. ID1715]NNM77628.1 peptidylprolyl isomerase [Sphingomonas sp. ID1715]
MLTFALLLQAAAPAPATAPKSPGEIVAAAPASDWIDIAPDDLLVMQLAPDGQGRARRVVIQLMPPPFSQSWIANIRTLAKAQWWDGTSVNRVQDNYVVQWGDATEKKPLPAGLVKTEEREYSVKLPEKLVRQLYAETVQQANSAVRGAGAMPYGTDKDSYAKFVMFLKGVPVGLTEDGEAWPLHCYGMVGVGRNLSPDAGNGAELYTVIGHAPRHLDRNIALVGRVVEGVENLSSLPRGTGQLGFYEKPEERVGIVSVRLASELPAAERPRMQYLSTESATFAAYAEARANRKDAFFNVPAGGADICNVPVPIRRKP